MSKLLQSVIVVSLLVGAFIYHRAKQSVKIKKSNAEKINTMDKTVKKDQVETSKPTPPEKITAADVPKVEEPMVHPVEEVKVETQAVTGTVEEARVPETKPIVAEPAPVEPQTKTPEEITAAEKARAAEEAKIMAEMEAQEKAEDEAREKAEKEEQAKIIEEAKAAAGKARKEEFEKFSYERKMEDIQDYSALLKPQLLKKYNEIEFNNLVQQSGLLLKDEAKYEREKGKANAEKVKKFIDDVIIGERTRQFQ